MARACAVAAAAALVTVLAVSATAAARIVPQRGIAGVTLGMPLAKVRAAAGRPARVIRGTNEFGRFTELRYAGLRVTLQGSRSVTSIRTTRRAERTASGAGTTERQLRQRVRGLTCRTEFHFRHCYLGAFRPGRRVTDFHLRRGRVTAVTVGIVID